MKLVQPTPDWLVQFNRNFDGVAGQMTNLTIDGKAYSISFVCKPTDCAGHKFVVLFDANGERAYGALGGKDNDPAFFGSPTRGRAGSDGEGGQGVGRRAAHFFIRLRHFNGLTPPLRNFFAL